MNHAELSRRLALAIGYAPECVRIDEDSNMKYEPCCKVYRISNDMGPYWRRLDYRDPSVALPVLKWLMREYDVYFMPSDYLNQVRIRRSRMIADYLDAADTLPAAIALAACAVRRV